MAAAGRWRTELPLKYREPEPPHFPFKPEKLGPGHWKLAGYEVKRHGVRKWKIVSELPNGHFSSKEAAFGLIKRIYFRVYYAADCIEHEIDMGSLMPTRWGIHSLERQTWCDHIEGHEDESICDSTRK